MRQDSAGLISPARRKVEGDEKVCREGSHLARFDSRLAIDAVDGSGCYAAGNALISAADEPTIHHHEDGSS